MRAWGRQQLAFSDETMHFFMDVELTMSQFRALVMIRRWGPQTGRELATRLQFVAEAVEYSLKLEAARRLLEEWQAEHGAISEQERARARSRWRD